MEKDREKDRKKPVCQNPLFDTPAFYHTNFNTLSFYLTATLLTVPSWERTTYTPEEREEESIFTPAKE